MLMKEKMPLTPVTPVPAPSAAITAETNRKGPPATEPREADEPCLDAARC